MCDLARFHLPARGKANLYLMHYLASGIGTDSSNETSLIARGHLRRYSRVECVLILKISAFFVCIQDEFTKLLTNLIPY